MEKIYRLTPALKDNIWGGNKLRDYGKESDKDRIAESWELSFTNGGEARIADGTEMSRAFPREAWGTSADKFHAFPVLTKFIDAKDNLSVQVQNSQYQPLIHKTHLMVYVTCVFQESPIRYLSSFPSCSFLTFRPYIQSLFSHLPVLVQCS